MNEDLNSPLVNEAMKRFEEVGNTSPKRYTLREIFAWLENEAKKPLERDIAILKKQKRLQYQKLMNRICELQKQLGGKE